MATPSEGIHGRILMWYHAPYVMEKAMSDDALSREVDQNYDYFQRNLSQFLDREKGRFALLRHRTILGFYDEPGEAAAAAATQFQDDLYSIQEVTNLPVDLGFYSYAAG